MRKSLPLLFALFSLGAVHAFADSITLTFTGLRDLEPIANFYNGGAGGLGSTGGTNYGIAFSSDSLAVISTLSGGSGNFSSPPAPASETVAFFLSGSGDTMNVAGGFETGFSFFYAATSFPGSVTVFSGLNGTGDSLGTLSLPSNGSFCDGKTSYSCWSNVGVGFAGTAQSVVFSGSANYIAFADVTLGASSVPTDTTVPEPGTLLLAGRRHAGARRSGSPQIRSHGSVRSTQWQQERPGRVPRPFFLARSAHPTGSRASPPGSTCKFRQRAWDFPISPGWRLYNRITSSGRRFQPWSPARVCASPGCGGERARIRERQSPGGEMSVILSALLLGFVAGLRAVLPIAAVSWAARTGLLNLAGTPLAFLGYRWTPVILTVLALGELVNDKLPKTPSRKTPPQFVVRVLSGALVGAAVGASAGSLVTGLLCGAVGAVAGTLGGAAARGWLASRLGRDLPAALIEDATAIVLALAVSLRL